MMRPNGAGETVRNAATARERGGAVRDGFTAPFFASKTTPKLDTIDKLRPSQYWRGFAGRWYRIHFANLEGLWSTKK